MEEEKKQLTKEEILELSRAENKNGDERDRQRYPVANSIGFSVGLLLAGIVILVSSFCADRFPSEVVVVVAGMQAAQALYVGITVKRLRKVYLTIGIVECVVAVALAVLWILELCGVAV